MGGVSTLELLLFWLRTLWVLGAFFVVLPFAIVYGAVLAVRRLQRRPGPPRYPLIAAGLFLGVAAVLAATLPNLAVAP